MAGAPTVYIPSYNRHALLATTLGSLRSQTVAHNVVVVDNGSTDDSVAGVRREFPDVEVLELSENLGFGRALNVAVRAHPADVVIFINNDVDCEPTFVERMVGALGHEVASVAGVLLQHADPSRIDSAGVVADRTLLSVDYLHGHDAGDAFAAPGPLGPTGGAALYRLEAFRDAGGFDEQIFAYLEDVDLALRLRGAGATCRLAPEARAIHRHSATLGAGSARKNELMGWSRGYLLRRYGVLRRPGRALRAVTCEAAICAGQLLADRTVSGIRGRAAGWRSARGMQRRPWPADGLLHASALEMLRLRASRRGPFAR